MEGTQRNALINELSCDGERELSPLILTVIHSVFEPLCIGLAVDVRSFVLYVILHFC